MNTIEKIYQLERVKEEAKDELEVIRIEENPCDIMTRISIKNLEWYIKAIQREIDKVEKKINKRK